MRVVDRIANPRLRAQMHDPVNLHAAQIAVQHRHFRKVDGVEGKAIAARLAQIGDTISSFRLVW